VELVRLLRARGGEVNGTEHQRNFDLQSARQEIFNPACFEPLHSRGSVGFWKSSSEEFATSPCEVTSL